MNKKLKSISMLSIVIQGMIGVRLLTIPRDVVMAAGNDSWISMLIIGVISILNAYGFYWVAIKYPGLNFSQINEVVLGKILGKIVLLLIGAYTICTIGLSLRLFSNSIDVFLLEKTPTQAIIIVMLIPVIYCISTDIKSISIVFDILLPFLLFFIILLILLSITTADYKNMLPIFHRGIVPVLKGSIKVVDPLLACSIIAYVMPYFEDRKSTLKWCFIGVGISICIYIVILVLCIMAFGEKEIKDLLFPTLTLSKSIQLESQIFERAESLFMVAWIPNTFTTIVVYYLISSHNLKVLFNTQKNRLILYGQIPIFIAIALIPENITDVYRYLNLNNYLAIFLNFIYLPVFLLTVYIMKRGAHK